MRQDVTRGSSDDTPLLPGDRDAADQERESILRARRIQSERDLFRMLVAEFEDWGPGVVVRPR